MWTWPLRAWRRQRTAPASGRRASGERGRANSRESSEQAPPARRSPPPARPPSGRSRKERDPMKLSQFFIDRPIFAAVLSLLIVVGGGLALFRLPVSEYPSVAPPTV